VDRSDNQVEKVAPHGPFALADAWARLEQAIRAEQGVGAELDPELRKPAAVRPLRSRE
jgi:hypothetical protein